MDLVYIMTEGLANNQIRKTDIRKLDIGTLVSRGEKLPSRKVRGVGFVAHPSNTHLVDSYKILSLCLAILRLN
ncbi:hypothetical protein KIN20_012527 [Parelaphostrongylus tenuis]|uniref:Uncharacterized protein n=1 Tax=Parelaphostrongylus tenuis TaxID=148309 RepID=A0AAD5MEA7_PARTN|nr:hypothetical protein KIN20_012527 [Parelaphostrongylus tenuis]